MPELAGRISESVIDQAVEWYVKRASGLATAGDDAALVRWRQARPEHEQAWRQLESMQSLMQLRGLDASSAHGTLNKAAALQRRRRALKLLLLAAFGATGALAIREEESLRTQLASLGADLRTSAGELRDMMLPDGTRLQLNTATSVKLAYTALERRIELLEGEIMITTAQDARPFLVATREGELRPIGTRYSVAREAGQTRLAVLQGQVEIRSPAGVLRLRAGEQTLFSRQQFNAILPLEETSQSWAQGQLTAAGMRLDAFAAMLGRYRSGHLGCADAVRHLRVTGAWSLQGQQPTEAILESLERHLPVRVRRFTRYWLTIDAA